MRSNLTVRWMVPLLAGATITLGATAAVSALSDSPRRAPNGEARPAGDAALGGAQAKARLVGLFDAGGAPIRTKGVQSVKRIDKGLYCIRPKNSTGIKPAKAIVLLSTEYFHSTLTATKVEWAAKGSGCAKNRIGVYTYDDSDHDTNFSPSNEVAFSILVP